MQAQGQSSIIRPVLRNRPILPPPPTLELVTLDGTPAPQLSTEKRYALLEVLGMLHARGFVVGQPLIVCDGMIALRATIPVEDPPLPPLVPYGRHKMPEG